MKRKIVAILATRNTGSRLYGKPLQNLDIKKGITILDFLIDGLAAVSEIDAIALAISEGSGNLVFKDYATKKGIDFIVGDEIDVLGRLIQCAEHVSATDIFRVTSECPFLHYSAIPDAISEYLAEDLDGLFFDKIIDGCGFELIKVDALKKGHLQGEDRHRSELCTLYLRENKSEFKIKINLPDKSLIRRDLRLTVDYPEDLILCREVYENLKHLSPHIPVKEIVEFLEKNQRLIELVLPYTEAGYKSMYQ